MKKIVTLVSALLMSGMILTACGGSKAKEIDAAALSKSLVSDLEYAEEMVEVPEVAVGIAFDVPEGVTVNAYKSAGNTADYVAVFTSKDADTESKVAESAKKFIEEHAEQFKDYVPEETTRAENGLIYENGNYTVIVISKDQDAAKAMVEKAFK